LLTAGRNVQGATTLKSGNPLIHKAFGGKSRIRANETAPWMNMVLHWHHLLETAAIS